IELFFVYKDLSFESQELLTSNAHQLSLADAGSETRPLMLERGSYISWASHFRETEAPKMQKEEDLRGDDLKHYETEIEAMNLILISILNDIYNSMDACTTTKVMWRSTRLSIQSFCSVKNDLERNHIIFPKVTINTKFLNCLQLEWLKYVTQGIQFKTTMMISAMLLLARAITQNFSNPTNNRLCTSFNTKNQAIVQGDKVNIKRKNSGNDGRNSKRTVANVQCYNCSGKGHYAHNCLKPRIRDSKYFMEQMLLAKQDEARSFLLMNKTIFSLLMFPRWKKLRSVKTYA
nr:hypothetical protein [Tanacetum cinerariifolium]